MRFTVDRLDHIVLNCSDVELIAAWYQRVLGMEREDFGPDRRAQRLDAASMALEPRQAAGGGPAPVAVKDDGDMAGNAR